MNLVKVTYSSYFFLLDRISRDVSSNRVWLNTDMGRFLFNMAANPDMNVGSLGYGRSVYMKDLRGGSFETLRKRCMLCLCYITPNSVYSTQPIMTVIRFTIIIFQKCNALCKILH